MKHYIIAKFKNEVDWKSFVFPIKKLFNPVIELEGVENVIYQLSNSDKENRYHIMIIIECSQNGLSHFDTSLIHSQWKELYGPLLEGKAIFDCD